MPFLLAGRFRRWISYDSGANTLQSGRRRRTNRCIDRWGEWDKTHTWGILHDWEDGFLIHCDLDVNVQALLVGNLFTRTEANTTFLRGLNLMIHRKFDAKTFARFKQKNLSTSVERTAKQHIVKKNGLNKGKTSLE